MIKLESQEREIPNKVQAFFAFDINASSATLIHKANVQGKKVCMCELCFPTSDTDKDIWKVMNVTIIRMFSLYK